MNPYAGKILTAKVSLDLLGNPIGPPRTTLHPAQPADRVTDNRDQFRKRWYRIDEATNFTEATR